MNKEFRDIKKGDTFRPLGSPGRFLVAQRDALVNTERGVVHVMTDAFTMPALGHLRVEVK